MADIFGTISTIDSDNYNISRYISKFTDMLIEFVVCSFTSKKVFILQRIRHLFEIISQLPLYIFKHLYTHLNCGFLNILYT